MLTTTIIVSTIAVSLLAFSNVEYRGKLIFNPYIVEKNREWYRFITSGLIHADVWHLGINMFVLYSFGGIVENYFKVYFDDKSSYYFILLYFGGMVAAIIPTYKKHKADIYYNALGASGAVSAIVFSFIIFDPMQKICLYGILCLPGILFGVLYVFYCYYMDKRGKDNVNHDAHLWGAVYGFCFTIILKPTLLMEFFQKLIYFRNVI